MGVVALALLTFVPQGVIASDEDQVRPFLEGERVRMADIRSKHCHDGRFPRLDCFAGAPARDADLAMVVGEMAFASEPYATVYRDADYGGSSLTLFGSYSNLGVIGWNDAITSFKSLNGGRPRFYRDAGYGGVSWRWPAGAWVANVGSPANDSFTAVENDP
jgi:hypothetical protein